MSAGARLLHWGVWGGLALVVLSITGVFTSTLLFRRVPPPPIYGAVPEFHLTNQVGRAVSLADLRGHVWIADIIFTRCPGPCAQMTRQMKALQQKLPSNSNVRLVSLTADPSFDTPAVLQTYANRFNAEPENWDFLTGPKPELYRLATHGLKLALQENVSTNIDEMFIHSTRLVVIDQLGRLRGAGLDGSDQDPVPEIVRTVRQLLAEAPPR
jgi:protein SCO1